MGCSKSNIEEVLKSPIQKKREITLDINKKYCLVLIV